MTALVTRNLSLLTGAPNGMAKLRELILNLATRGKLAEQIGNSEPASKLVARLKEYKEDVARQGEFRRPKVGIPVDLGCVPFSIPEGWCWARWNDIALKIGDIDHQMPESDPNGVPFVSPRDFFPGNVIDFDGAKRVSRADFERLSAKIRAERGDLIYPRYGTIGENVLVEVDREFLVSYSCAVVKVANGFIDPYFQFYVSLSHCIRNQAKAAENKTTQANVGIKSIQEFLFPVPPLEEQHRIVAKVDELMALCDRLEAEQADAEAARAQLVEALLASLTQARDAADFRASWQQLSEHFHTLFTTEASVDALKQTVLQLGVMGRLTATSKSSGAASSASPLAEATFEIPDDWKWCRFGDCWESSFYGPRFGKHDYVSAGGVPTIRTTDMSADGLIDLKSPPEVVLSTAQLQTYGLKHGDLLVTRSGSIGTMALFMLEMDAIPSAYLIRIRFLPKLLPRFGLIYLRSPMGQRLLGLNTTSVGVPNVNATKMATFPFALPPREHQQQVVDKVEELLAFCDQLKLNLTQARQHHEHLASVLVEQAVG